MQPVFHIGDVLASHFEDKTEWNVEKLSISFLLIEQLFFCAPLLYHISMKNVFLCLSVLYFVKQDYDRKNSNIGNKIYKEIFRTGYGSIVMFINVIGYMLITIEILFSNGYIGLFFIISMTFSILSDLLYYANPLPPVKKHQLQFT